MPHAIRIHAVGGPESMRWEEIGMPSPGAGQVLVRNSAIGLNFIDAYFRAGRYVAPLPFIPGNEGAGVVEAVGPEVHGFAVGDRVAYADPIGSYAEWLLRPAGRLVKLPDAIDERAAAAMMLKGMTSEYLLRRTYKVQPGDTILFHAAAGGVGQIACQWAKHLGATVIGTVGSAAKRATAEAVGCDHVIVTDSQDLVARVREITNGRGVPVVYDGVGGDMFMKSLDCLSPLGIMVAFGAASGPVPPFDIIGLSTRGSLFVTRPTLGSYTSTPEALQASADALFDVVAGGYVKIDIAQTYKLADAASAHIDLEARKLTGSTLLLP